MIAIILALFVIQYLRYNKNLKPNCSIYSKDYVQLSDSKIYLLF